MSWFWIWVSVFSTFASMANVLLLYRRANTKAIGAATNSTPKYFNVSRKEPFALSL